MISNIYYLMGFIFLLHEISWVFNIKYRIDQFKRFTEYNKAHKNLKWDEFSEEHKTDSKNILFICFTIIPWMFIGLLTVQWAIFLIFIAFNIAIIGTLSALVTKYGKIYTIIHWINSVIGVIFSTFVILNHFHLHINTTKIISDYISNLLT